MYDESRKKSDEIQLIC